tara:strand:- start:639 stop:908 length:270 start_codon:yes stop_codon:yes gene_type:complete
MARYRNTQIGSKNNKNYYNTTIYEKVPERNTDSYFIAQEGDRCDNLATQFYGNPDLWWFVARVNNLKTMNIPAGTELRIPAGIISAKGS